MKRAIIYGRVSTEDQLEKYGLIAQLRACRDMAKTNGYRIVHEITDDGITGSIIDRPGLNRVRELVAAGAADVVLMLDADRLSRVLVDLLILKPEIEKRAALEFVTGKFEDSPSGELFFSMKGAIAQYERKVIRERTMRGKKERARAGRIVGGRTAYGYIYADGALSPDPERADTVRHIYTWFLQGIPIRRIASMLREAGVPTWGGRMWGRSSVSRILSNETYAGVAHFGTYRREGTVLRLRDPRDRIALSVPALVSRDTWERAQSRFHRIVMPGRPSPTYLLRGILFCGECGRKMGGQAEHKGKRHVYRCCGRDRLNHGTAKCSVRGPNALRLDDAIWTTLQSIFTDRDRLHSILREYEQGLRAANRPARREVLTRKLATARQREERCLSLMLDADLASAKDEIKRKYLDAQRARVEIEREIAKASEVQGRVMSAEKWIDRTADLLREYIPTLTTPRDRQEFAHGLISRAVWDGSSAVTLHCFLGTEMDTISSHCDHFVHPKTIDSNSIEFTLTVRLAA